MEVSSRSCEDTATDVCWCSVHLSRASHFSGPGLLGSLCTRTEHVVVELVDMATLDFRQQVSLVASSDVLMGFHGAALGHIPMLPEYGGILEMWHQPTWRCLEVVAALSGRLHVIWENPDLKAVQHLPNGKGERIRVHIPGVLEKARSLVSMVAAAKRRAASLLQEVIAQ